MNAGEGESLTLAQFASAFIEPAVVLTGDGLVVEANAAARRVFGIERGETHIKDILQDDGALARFLRMSAQTPHPILHRLQRPGNDAPLRCEGSLLRPRTAVSQALILLRCRPHEEPDIFRTLNGKIEELHREVADWRRVDTERQTLIEQLEESVKALASANAAKDEFLTLVSHELRTPITIILGGSDLLYRRWQNEADDTNRALFDDIRRAAGRLSQLVENLLVLARSGHEDDLSKEPVLLARGVNAAVAIYRRNHPEREIRVSHSSPTEVVEGSQLAIELITGNLLSNADKYSPPGLPVDVEVAQKGPFAVVRVSDCGPGLTPEDLARAFDPFYRGDEAKRRATGFGIGLAVCRRLAATMAGGIEAYRREVGGTVFEVTLPRMELSAAEGARPY